MPSHYPLLDKNVALPSFPHKNQNTNIELRQESRESDLDLTAALLPNTKGSADARKPDIPNFFLALSWGWYLISQEF